MADTRSSASSEGRRPAQAGRRPSRRTDWWLSEGRSEKWLIWDRLAISLALLALWQWAVAAEILNARFIPAPTSIVTGMWEVLQLGNVRSALLQAAWMFAVAFAIAAVIGTFVGAAVGLSNTLYRVLNPFIMMLFATPKLIFLPLFIVFFGVQFSAKVAYGVTSGIFPLMVTVISGARAVDRRLLESARSMGASRFQSIIRVSIPASFPAVFVGLWHCIKHALLGVLIMELFVSQRGIGRFIRSYTSGFQPDKVFALVFITAFFAIGVSQLVRVVERRVSGWRER